MISDCLFYFFFNCLNHINNKLIELEHFNSLLVFENSIMCDSLKGLYKGLENLISSESITQKLLQEFQIISTTQQKFHQHYLDLNQDLCQIIKEKDSLFKSANKFLSENINFKDLKTKLSKFYKDSLKSLKAELIQIQSINERLKIENIDLEKKYINASAELNAIRKKYSKISTQVEYFDIERVCVNCQKVYHESENFNWTCQIHSSKYSGHLYWCCGKTAKNAVGCKLMKHVCQEEIDENNQKKKHVLAFCTVNFKQNCKGRGHSCAECPKDPNARTNFEIHKEVQRLKDFQKLKQKVVIGSFKTSRFFNIKEKKSRSEINSPVSDSFENENNVFADLSQLKMQACILNEI